MHNKLSFWHDSGRVWVPILSPRIVGDRRFTMIRLLKDVYELPRHSIDILRPRVAFDYYPMTCVFLVYPVFSPMFPVLGLGSPRRLARCVLFVIVFSLCFLCFLCFLSWGWGPPPHGKMVPVCFSLFPVLPVFPVLGLGSYAAWPD